MPCAWKSSIARTCTAIDCLAAVSTAFGSLLALRLPLGERPARRQVAVERIVRGGLVGHHVGPDAAPHQLGEDLGGIAEQADRHRLACRLRLLDDRQRLVEVVGLAVEIAGLQPHLDAGRLAFDRQHRGARHGGGERLGAAHAAEPAGQDPAPGEVAAVVPAADLDEGLVGALNDALAADIDPRARRSSGRTSSGPCVSSSLKWSQVAQCGTRLELAISTRGASSWVRKTPTGLPDWTSSVSSSPRASSGAATMRSKRLPVARGPADAAIDHQLLRLLGHLGVEIVHQHAQRRLGQPALGAQRRPARAADLAGVVETGGWGRRRRGHGCWSLHDGAVRPWWPRS